MRAVGLATAVLMVTLLSPRAAPQPAALEAATLSVGSPLAASVIGGNVVISNADGTGAVTTAMEDVPIAVEFRWRPDDLTRQPYHTSVLIPRQFQQVSR